MPPARVGQSPCASGGVPIILIFGRVWPPGSAGLKIGRVALALDCPFPFGPDSTRSSRGLVLRSTSTPRVVAVGNAERMRPAKVSRRFASKDWPFFRRLHPANVATGRGATASAGRESRRTSAGARSQRRSDFPAPPNPVSTTLFFPVPVFATAMWNEPAPSGRQFRWLPARAGRSPF
jgi:hypothetical protein